MVGIALPALLLSEKCAWAMATPHVCFTLMPSCYIKSILLESIRMRIRGTAATCRRGRRHRASRKVGVGVGVVLGVVVVVAVFLLRRI